MVMALMPTTTIPRALRKGDTIAFISPSARLNEIFPYIIERAKPWLEQQGYHVKIIFNTSPKRIAKNQFSGAAKIHSAFWDTWIKAIICTVGGSHPNELIRHLDYALIKANPKIFCGYSDITVLHYALFHGANHRTF
jgi:muramoyltetrapeptide carboxypeptidase LdcA involved in peptidoglycan recycling